MVKCQHQHRSLSHKLETVKATSYLFQRLRGFGAVRELVVFFSNRANPAMAALWYTSRITLLLALYRNKGLTFALKFHGIFAQWPFFQPNFRRSTR